MEKVAIIIPIYNAEKTLTSVFDRIPKNILFTINEFILVNDSSTDNTRYVIKNLKLNYKNLIVIQHPKNLGYGAAQKSGFRQALDDDMDIVVILHADGQYPPEKINDFIEPIKKGEADIICGSRFLKESPLKQGMPLERYLGKVLLNMVENFVLRQKLTVYHEGYRSYSRKVLELINFNNYSNYFAFDSEMLIGAITNKLKICETPIPTYYGQEKSYLDPLRYGWVIFLIMIKYLLGQYRDKNKNKKWQILF